MAYDPIETAHRQVSAGQHKQAVSTLAAASAQGDPSALAELATWYLRGDILSRDIARARALLRRAVEIGHVDAALMEVALIATGAGKPTGWNAALQRLQEAAIADPVARTQLDLVEAMSLSPDGMPCSVRTSEPICDQPMVKRYRGLLTPAECAHIANFAKDLLEPALVIDPATGKLQAHPVRTSSGATIGPAHENLVIHAINRRIATVTNTGFEQGEPLAVLRYTHGQEYRPHHDCIAGAANQRIKTVLIYLNDGFAGGETCFLSNGLKIAPHAGDAIIFDNTLPDGSIDRSADHAGLPVRQGIKWLATRWIRAASYDPWNGS